MQALTIPVYRTSPVEILESEIRKVCGAFDLEPMRGSGLVAGDVALRRMEYFDAAVVALDARHVQRSARSIRQDPGEHLYLLVQDEGHCRVEQGGRSVVLAPADMFLVDSIEPSAFVYGGRRSNQVSVHMPRDEMLHRFGDACTGGVAVDRQDPLWIAMRAVLTKMLTGPDVQVQLREAFLCLMGAYLQAGRSSARASETLLSRALTLVDRHREDPTFGPGELASRLNVSERVLQRHFKVLGETPGHRLLNRRLELAHARLSARPPEQAREGVAGIAYGSGFNDLSYFYREFRKRYGTTPGAVARH
ncbi:AraC family transcriptional regulator, positive regulator of tynA and feaB (plasmid) [Ensifer sp. WSM1721]|uniref:helix-turn-helix domain-containing protein n=1 Tax=Ensifer sp. WSM1721 TaxID=1041159 RepID=UPI00047A811A|nr:helix-turn-helix domain-containing protein [Ensifer sp. WSM1721]